MKLEKKPISQLTGLAIAILGKIAVSFLIGYHPFFDYFWMFPLLIGFSLASLILVVVRFITLVKLIYQRKPFIAFSIVWIILVIMFWFSGIDSTIAGSMTALYLAGPEQVEIESRALIQNCISDSSYCGEITNVPSAIQRLHPYSVDVTKEYTFILKFRVFDDYGGFKILAPEKVIPGIKVRDGFYWVERRFN
jgi:hypothetical protein